MSFSWTSFDVVAIFFTLTVTGVLSELVVLRHPPVDDGKERNLTCISEDDGSALVWNYELENRQQIKVTNFKPERPEVSSWKNCAIWNSTKCITQWQSLNGWEVVDSVSNPMGPVSDNRWEDFEEFVFEQSTENEKYKYVKFMNRRSYTVIFSIRGSENVNILLCKRKKVKGGPCNLIRIGIDEGGSSDFSTCTTEESNDIESGNSEICTLQANDEHKHGKIIDANEWRAFRLEWRDKTTKLYENTERNPFLQRHIDLEYQTTHILIKSSHGTRVRFHFYEYFLTTNNLATIATGEFQYLNNFCLELLVGLCQGCNLIVQLLDENGSAIKTKHIVGRYNDTVDELMIWQSIEIKADLSDFHSTNVKLEIKSSSSQKKSQWAIGYFRTCKSIGNLRTSTITVRRNVAAFQKWPKISCQKLSYTKGMSKVTNSLSTLQLPEMNVSEKEYYMKYLSESCGSQCENFNVKSSICHPEGCSCGVGFEEINCDDSDMSDYHSYRKIDRSVKCPHCKSELCNNANDYCEFECSNNKFVPPSCKTELDEPTVSVQSYELTSIKQNIVGIVEPTRIAKVTFFLQVDGRGDNPETYIAEYNVASLIYEKEINNPYRDRNCTVYTVVELSINNKMTTVIGPMVSFVSTPNGEQCFDVVTTENSLTVKFFNKISNCEDVLNTQYSVNIGNRNRIRPQFPVIIENLDPYTDYEVKLKIVGIGIIYRKKVRTLDVGPGEVDNLCKLNSTESEVTVGWTRPRNSINPNIKYKASIKRDLLLGCANLGKESPPSDVESRELYVTRVTFTRLNPYARYTVTVTAYTTEAGPPKSIEFQTSETDVPTSNVSNLEFDPVQYRLRWDMPEDCSTITGNIWGTKLIFKNIEDPNNMEHFEIEANSIEFDLSNSESLLPFTKYKVYACILRSLISLLNDIDRCQSLNVTTPPTAPPSVTHLIIYDADYSTNTISVGCLPPHPPKGELESYHVSISEIDKKISYLVIEASRGNCERRNGYACFENINLDLNVTTGIKLKLRVQAKNKQVEKIGDVKSYTFEPQRCYEKEPDGPLNFTATLQGRGGNVLLKWEPPAFSPTKIIQYRIYLEALQNFLLDDKYKEFEKSINYTALKYQKEYVQELQLPPSANYRFSIASFNSRGNISSNITEIYLNITGAVDFLSKKDPEVNADGSLVEIEIPKLVNATRNTTLQIIVRGRSTCRLQNSDESSSNLNKTIVINEWVAKVYKVENIRPEPLKIYTKNNNADTKCFLNDEETYEILFVVTDHYSGASANFTSSKFTLIDNGSSQTSTIVTLLILAIIIICAASVFIWYKKRNEIISKIYENDDIQLDAGVIETGDSTAPVTPKDAMPLPYTTKNQESIAPSFPDILPLYDENSTSVKVEEFEEYTKEALASGLLNQQYTTFASGLEKSCDYGSLPENALKNRYKDRLPYDDTRVSLKNIEHTPNSDYINASYIQGYRKSRAYIATQGPKLKTVKDFWRMVWENEVQVICMLANVVEGGKKKCEQYWPEIGTKVKYGNVQIKNEEHKVFADYTFRKFTLGCGGIKRTVTHLHYTGWPDHGVPMYTQSLVAYLKKLLATSSGNGPVVVHCSAGVGRTGTIILCDICLRQAFSDRVIDVPSTLIKIRECRRGMVDNAQQYVLAHLAILECMIIDQTQIPCDDFLPDRITELRKQLKSDIKRLKETVWQDRALHSLNSASNKKSMNVNELVPGEDDNNYVNAVSVDGVKMKNQYLASKLPSIANLPNYWKLIADKKIELIIILQRADVKNSSCVMTLGRSIIEPLPNLKVQAKEDIRKGEHFTINRLLLTEISEESDERTQPVTILTCTGLSNNKTDKPPAAVTLVMLWLASEKISRKEGLTLVLCRDGVTTSGLYLALSFLLERIAVEKECDVISAVRAVRRSNIEFVNSLQQFQFLYDAAIKYVKSFETYANFS